MLSVPHSAATANRLADENSPRVPPTLHPLRNPICPWDAEYGYHRAYETGQEPEVLVPAAVSGHGLRFLLRPAASARAFAEESTYPTFERRFQGPPDQPKAALPPFAYPEPQLPFGRGRPMPMQVGSAYPPPTPSSPAAAAAMYPPLSPYGFPQEHRRLQNLHYEVRPRNHGDSRVWQTSSMLMNVQAFGGAAYK